MLPVASRRLEPRDADPGRGRGACSPNAFFHREDTESVHSGRCFSLTHSFRVGESSDADGGSGVRHHPLHSFAHCALSPMHSDALFRSHRAGSSLETPFRAGTRWGSVVDAARPRDSIGDRGHHRRRAEHLSVSPPATCGTPVCVTTGDVRNTCPEPVFILAAPTRSLIPLRAGTRWGTRRWRATSGGRGPTG
jgi:hypothetical protein